MPRTLARIVLAPFFLVGVILATVLVVFVVATISIGGWCETILLRAGYRHKPVLLPAVIGIVLFAGLVLLGMGELGHQLIGWPGTILGPTLGIVLIAVVDRW